MKKFLSILVLGFLFSGNTYAECVNIYGKVYCSNQKDGSVMNIYGQTKCTGGCVRGDSNLCEIL